jgi:hypothetical protein
MNVYALREKTNNLYLSSKRGIWVENINNAKIYSSLGDAKKSRSFYKNRMEIKASKIEIVEYELIERKTV